MGRQVSSSSASSSSSFPFFSFPLSFLLVFIPVFHILPLTSLSILRLLSSHLPPPSCRSTLVLLFHLSPLLHLTPVIVFFHFLFLLVKHTCMWVTSWIMVVIAERLTIMIIEKNQRNNDLSSGDSLSCFLWMSLQILLVLSLYLIFLSWGWIWILITTIQKSTTIAWITQGRICYSEIALHDDPVRVSYVRKIWSSSSAELSSPGM